MQIPKSGAGERERYRERCGEAGFRGQRPRLQ